MQFCDDCGALLPASEATGECEQCGAQFEQSTPSRGRDGEPSADRAKTSTALERLPTTKTGSIKKADAVEWLTSLDNPSSAELRRATVEKPSGFSGSTFPTDVSTIRLTGDPEFIETVAGLFTQNRGGKPTTLVVGGIRQDSNQTTSNSSLTPPRQSRNL